ncbi:MAG: DUF502 domain-containing protein [Thermaerobacter sp.]|nr:DUF502 domain-containing protein [Thermaerobacter sp.]
MGGVRLLRTYFLSGLVWLLPVFITVYIAYHIFLFTDDLLGGLIYHWLGFYLPGLGLIATLVLIVLLGALMNNFLGRAVLRQAETALLRLPVLRGVYEASRQLVNTFLGRDRGTLRQVVLVPYGGEGSKVLGFVVAPATPALDARVGVFIPFSPPTAGFLFFYREQDLLPLSLSVEEALRLIMSGGTLQPPSLRHPPAGYPPQ